MLLSPAANLAFAHYPKTAGHSLVTWFRETLPDATFVEPPQVYTISHLPVRDSLERLGLAAGRPPRLVQGWQQFVAALFSAPANDAGGLKIIGVMREPFEMLVSLYEYWRTYDFPEPPAPPLIRAAREQPFRDFLAMAVVDRQIQTYHDFFDVGWPAWPRTLLLDFESLKPALVEACRELVVPPPEFLARRNTGPRPDRDLGPYRAEAGPLLDRVHQHFRWYYTQGKELMLRG